MRRDATRAHFAAPKMKDMGTSNAPDEMPSSKFSIPRWMAHVMGFFALLIAIPLGHGVVPWAVSLLMPHYGWTDGRPVFWNLLGLVPILLGIAGLIWVMILGLSHTHELPERVELNWTPKLLLMRGPYAFSRNPMYLAELSLWFGWALFYGSVSVLMGLGVFWGVANFIVVPWEERALKVRFGAAYREYMSTVPRWLGQGLAMSVLASRPGRA